MNTALNPKSQNPNPKEIQGPTHAMEIEAFVVNFVANFVANFVEFRFPKYAESASGGFPKLGGFAFAVFSA
jgi:hypothetical protein